MGTRAATSAGRRRASARRGPATRAKRPTARRPTKPARSKPARGTPARKPTRTAAKRPAPKRRTSQARRPPVTAGLSHTGQLLLLAVLLASLTGAYFGWLRDSSLVAISEVEVTGVTTKDGGRLEAALADAAEDMTTLHVRTDELVEVAAGFPTVASLSTDTSFPNGLTIHVTEHHPVLVARTAGRAVPVGADGTLLVGLPAEDAGLPTLAVAELPEAGRLEGDSLAQALVVGGAPKPLLPQITRTEMSRDLGVVVTLRGGFALRFGSPARARAKWAAATAVLADPDLTTVSYVDVRVPERPAVGGAGPSTTTETATDPALAADPDVAAAATATSP